MLNFANTIISAGGALIGTSLTDKGELRPSLQDRVGVHSIHQSEDVLCGSGEPWLALECLQ